MRILIPVAACVHQAIDCLVHIGVVGEAVQWIFGAVKTVCAAVGLCRPVESHFEAMAQTDQPWVKRLIGKHRIRLL